MNLFTAWEIGGAVVTIIAAIITYLKSAESAKWNYVLTVSLLGLIFTFLVSIRYEIIPKTQFLAYQLVKNQNEADIFSLLLNVKGSEDYKHNDIFKEQIENKIEKFQADLKKAYTGEFEVSKDNIPLFSDNLIHSAKKTIYATSYVKGTEWWLSVWGQQYEKINYELREKGVKITRYFIFSNQKEFEELKELIRRHTINKIETYVIFNWKSSSYVHTEDLILVDDQISGRLILDPEKNMKMAVMSVNQIEIKNIKERFKKINKASIPAEAALLGE